MIAEMTQDLIDKLKEIAPNPFGTTPTRVGLAVGGKNSDPMMVKVDRPAAWVMFVGDENIDPTERKITCNPVVRHNFIVKIIIDYTTESDILAEQYPILDAVRTAIHASTGVKGSTWRYDGQQLEELTDRMIYEQRYSLTVSA
jgi:phage gp37-like protein